MSEAAPAPVEPSAPGAQRADGPLPALGPRPERPVVEGGYEIRFAATEAELRTAQRLRYDVFNLELGEGLATSHATGLDRDEFDAGCHHLLVIDRRTDAVIGTYRMQTAEMAAGGTGFYCAGEFDLGGLPAHVIDHGIEVGRACIAKEHRRQRVLFALWKGLAAYLDAAGKRFLFGCCSLTSQDVGEGLAMLAHLQSHGHMHAAGAVRPRPGYECLPGDDDGAPSRKVTIPPLFSTYLRYGGKVFGPPAIDRHFKTIDFLVVLDTFDLDDAAWRTFFGRPRPTSGGHRPA